MYIVKFIFVHNVFDTVDSGDGYADGGPFVLQSIGLHVHHKCTVKVKWDE